MTQSNMGSPQFRCIVCDRYIKRNEVLWSHKVERIDGATCICEDCLPEWKEKINPPDLTVVHDTEKKESFISHYFHHAHKSKLKHISDDSASKPESHFEEFITSSLDDPPLRAILLAMANTPTPERKLLLDTMIAQLELKDPPKELLSVLHDLRNDDMASKAIQMLK